MMNSEIRIAIKEYLLTKIYIDEKEKDLLNQWENSKKLPRKLKKKVRKELILELHFLEWEKRMFT